MDGENGYLSAGDLRARARKDVDLPSGGKVLIRRIGKAQLGAAVKGIPDITAGARAADRSQPGSPDDLIHLGIIIEEVLLAGVLSPKLISEKQAQAGEPGCTPRDFTDEEQDLLFAEIMKLSKFTSAEGARGNG